MRVGVNVEQLLSRSPGGIGRYSAQLAMLLATCPPADEVIPFVARHRGGEVRTALARAGISAPAVVLPLPRQILYESWVRRGRPALTFGAPGLRDLDVVHAPSVAVPGRGRTPLVVTVHDAASELWPDAFTARGRRFHALGLAAAAARADLVITVSQAAADEIVARSPIRAGQLRVVHHGISPPDLTDAARHRMLAARGLEDRRYVLWVGSLEPRKDVTTLVEAMARAASDGASGGSDRRVSLVLAGYRGWLSEGIVSSDARAALGTRLVELGPVGEDELWALYGGASLFAFPSRHEGFGLPPLEAMSQGCPVVCSDLPVTREVLGDAAVRIPAGDVEVWADAIAGLLDDEPARLALAGAGRQRAAAYSAERFITATRAVYREVIGA